MAQQEMFAAYIGLDWAQQAHVVCIFRAAGGPARLGKVEHSPEAIAAWVAELRREFGGRPVAVCLELARGALVYALMQYDFLTLYPINPKQLAAYRAALHPSGAKDDPADAELLARFLRDHADRLRAWRPDDATTRALRLTTEQRRKWVQDRVALTNKLGQRLRETYVLALELGGSRLWGERFLTLLEKFPSQRELQRASPKQLERWLPKRRRVVDDPPPEELLRARIAAVRKAKPMTNDGAVLRHGRLAVVHLVAMIRAVNRAVAECDQTIQELFAEHADAALFASLPGAGPALAPRLAAAFGTDREKFRSPRDMQQLSGIAPVTRSSGKTKSVHLRWACPKFLRQTFHEFARTSIHRSRWAAAYVAMRTACGHPYQAIIRGLAFKWQRIIHRCWQTRQAYDESRYLQRLRATGSQLIKFLPPEPATAH